MLEPRALCSCLLMLTERLDVCALRASLQFTLFTGEISMIVICRVTDIKPHSKPQLATNISNVVPQTNALVYIYSPLITVAKKKKREEWKQER